jgi:hypothetical protein
VHRYFVVAKHNEFALGGATTQFRRIGRMYHLYHGTASFLVKVGTRSGVLI